MVLQAKRPGQTKTLPNDGLGRLTRCTGWSKDYYKFYHFFDFANLAGWIQQRSSLEICFAGRPALARAWVSSKLVRGGILGLRQKRGRNAEVHR